MKKLKRHLMIQGDKMPDGAEVLHAEPEDTSIRGKTGLRVWYLEPVKSNNSE